MTHQLQHGSILGGIAVVPDLEAALHNYRDVLGMAVVEQGISGWSNSQIIRTSSRRPLMAGRPLN